MAAPSSPTAPISTCVRPTYSCSCTKTHPASGTAPLVPLLLHRASPTLLLLTRDVDVVGGEAAKVEITVSPASLALFSSECGGCWCGHRRLKLAVKNPMRELAQTTTTSSSQCPRLLDRSTTRLALYDVPTTRKWAPASTTALTDPQLSNPQRSSLVVEGRGI